eukprot:SAG31_NODE_33_length_32018_cov_69.763088_3_plen_115_part_00
MWTASAPEDDQEATTVVDGLVFHAILHDEQITRCADAPVGCWPGGRHAFSSESVMPVSVYRYVISKSSSLCLVTSLQLIGGFPGTIVPWMHIMARWNTVMAHQKMRIYGEQRSL